MIDLAAFNIIFGDRDRKFAGDGLPDIMNHLRSDAERFSDESNPVLHFRQLQHTARGGELVVLIDGVRIEDSLGMAVNNGLLAEVVDPQFTPGAVGLIVGTLAGPNLSVGFDDVEIRIP